MNKDRALLEKLERAAAHGPLRPAAGYNPPRQPWSWKRLLLILFRANPRAQAETLVGQHLDGDAQPEPMGFFEPDPDTTPYEEHEVGKGGLLGKTTEIAEWPDTGVQP